MARISDHSPGGCYGVENLQLEHGVLLDGDQNIDF
jgi:hypothetical protein